VQTAPRSRTLRLRDVLGGHAEPDRIFFTNLWFRGHNNPRYAELLPRLHRLDRYQHRISDVRAVRAVQYRALHWPKHLRYRLVLGAASRRWRFLFTPDNDQIAYFSGRVVSDVDDPKFTAREAGLLNRSNVAAYVVTEERAARRFEELGVRKPFHVIPQGVSLALASPEAVADVRSRLRRDGEVVVGWMAAWLLSADDRDGDNPLYSVDHLLELWDEVHGRVPEARLWLIGGASDRVRARLRGREDVVLFGRLPRDEMLAHVANFDLGVYARTADQGIQAAKVAEYMGFGVPTVSYDYAVTQVLRETGAGVLVGSPREFVDALERLVRDAEARRSLAQIARRAGRELDWDVLARRYETEILDRYLV
jgi:glycosyltransferase involved in cell wall biosynthesis